MLPVDKTEKKREKRMPQRERERPRKIHGLLDKLLGSLYKWREVSTSVSLDVTEACMLTLLDHNPNDSEISNDWSPAQLTWYSLWRDGELHRDLEGCFRSWWKNHLGCSASAVSCRICLSFLISLICWRRLNLSCSSAMDEQRTVSSLFCLPMDQPKVVPQWRWVSCVIMGLYSFGVSLGVWRAVYVFIGIRSCLLPFHLLLCFLCTWLFLDEC